MATRQAPTLYKLAFNYFCGIRRTMSPLALEEIKRQGFMPAHRPNNYVEDTSEGWMQDVALFLKLNHMIVSGPAGTGKDLIIEAFCHAFNLPLARFAFKQGTNPVDWIYRTALVGDGKGGTETKEVEGDLLKACRGVTCKRDFTGATPRQLDEAIKDMEKVGYTVSNEEGMLTITVPAVILFSDYDRATPDQLEILRQALELNKEKLTHPITGEMFNILPNTRFYFTSNSGADGSEGGSNITQMKDSSLLSRCIGIKAPAPTPKFERMVVQAEFPMFDQDQVKLLVDCNRAIRKVAEEQDMGLEVTLRQALQWGHACLTVMDDLGITDFKKALKRSFVIIKGHLNLKHNSDAFEGAIDPYLRSDVVDAQSQASESVCPIDL
jgi:MoxR-like ATPase